MFGLLSAPLLDRQLLPGGQLRGPTPFVIAIMSFSMIIVAAAGLALSNAAGLVARGIETRYSVQVPAGIDLSKALETVRTLPSVTKVQAVPEEEMRQTLERWLGPAGASADLPVPALITLDVAGNANLTEIASRVEKAIKGARFIAHQDTLEPLLASLRASQWLAAALVGLMAAASSASVILAARGALDTHRATIEVMHGIGATDTQVAQLFQRKIALDAVAGSLVGGGAAAVALTALATSGAALAGDITGSAPLGGRDLLMLALIPVLLILLATWVARSAVLAALRKSI